MSDVLFEVTKEHLETGLRGIPVGYCTTSSVDPQKGLFYVGKEITSLANRSPEEVIFLLYHKREGTKEEIVAFAEDLKKRAPLKEETIRHIQALPKKGHPMALFSSALLIVGMIEGTQDYREDCLNLIAKVPLIGAYVINTHAGWKGEPKFNRDLSYMGNFANMLQIPSGVDKGLVDVLTLFNVLHYDHGGGNLSTFVGKAVASSLQDMYGSIASAMCALGGPRHGRANQDCLEFLLLISKELQESSSKEDLEKLIRKRLQNNQLIFGFGHAVLRVQDPRATCFYDLAKKRYPDDSLVKTALLLAEVCPKILKENPKIQNPYPNVDAISGAVLSAAGFNHPEYFTVLFGVSRVVGIAIQIVYERLEARDGKGTPIVRPKYLYKESL
jgi:citrate synthase